jgi:hypothetical protein
VAEGEAFWATISSNAERFRENAPEGMVAMAEIELRDGPVIEPAAVQRYPPWIVFEVIDSEADEAVKVPKERC